MNKKQQILVPYYKLNKWDKAKMGDKIYTFQKIDGMYAQWLNEEGKQTVGHNAYYTFNKEKWYYE